MNRTGDPVTSVGQAAVADAVAAAAAEARSAAAAIAGATRPGAGPGASTDPDQTTSTAARASQPQRREPLSNDALRLVARLASKAPLLETATHYPHVVNRIAQNWRGRKKLVKLLEELVPSDRPGRSGFPFPVAKELVQLREYYELSYLPVRSPAVVATRAPAAPTMHASHLDRRPGDEPLPWPRQD